MIVRKPRNFVVLPKSILRHDLTGLQLTLLAYIHDPDFCGHKPCNLIDIENVAKQFEVSPGSVLTALHQLSEIGIISINIEVGIKEITEVIP